MAAKEISESSFIVENLEEDLIQDILNTLESIDVNSTLFPNIPTASSEVTESVTEEASLDDESQGLFTGWPPLPSILFNLYCWLLLHSTIRDFFCFSLTLSLLHIFQILLHNCNSSTQYWCTWMDS